MRCASPCDLSTGLARHSANGGAQSMALEGVASGSVASHRLKKSGHACRARLAAPHSGGPLARVFMLR